MKVPRHLPWLWSIRETCASKIKIPLLYAFNYGLFSVHKNVTIIASVFCLGCLVGCCTSWTVPTPLYNWQWGPAEPKVNIDPELPKVLPSKPGVGQNIALHALPTALCNFKILGPFIFIFFRSSPLLPWVLGVVDAHSHAGLWNNVDHLAHHNNKCISNVLNPSMTIHMWCSKCCCNKWLDADSHAECLQNINGLQNTYYCVSKH